VKPAPKPRAKRAPVGPELSTTLYTSPLGVPYVRVQRAKEGGRAVFVDLPLRLLDEAISQLCERRGEAVAKHGAGCTRPFNAGQHGTYPDPYPRAASSGEAPTAAGEELP
jgi:hypothetical protein